MKKTLSVLAVLGIAAVIGTTSANAFTWSNLNPATWFGSGKCGCEKPKCGCEKIKKCDPCERAIEPCPTGAAAPCDPCMKKSSPCSIPVQPVQQPCSPCDRLQNMNK